MSNAGIAWGTDDVPISGYHPFPAIAHRMFMSPISSQTALRTMRSIIASACAPPPEHRVPVLLSELRVQDGRRPPVVQLEKLQQMHHRGPEGAGQQKIFGTPRNGLSIETTYGQ